MTIPISDLSNKNTKWFSKKKNKKNKIKVILWTFGTAITMTVKKSGHHLEKLIVVWNELD